MTDLILDGGHGGTDSGAIGIHGVYEKDLNLEMVLYMHQRLKSLGVKVKLTRDKDVTLIPSERTKKVRNSKAKVCLSVHFNAGGGDGFEAIHSIHSNGELARQIAGEVKKTGQNIRRVFTRTLPNGKDYYFMNRLTGNVSTVILEGCFIDNKKDFKDYDTWEERKVLAEAYIKGYCEYAGFPYRKASNKETFYRVVTGSFLQKENAENQLKVLQNKGYRSFIDVYTLNGKVYRRVVTGSFRDKKNAQNRLKDLESKGFKSFIDVYEG